MPDREQSETIEAVADAIERRGLTAAAILMLDAHRPYRPLASHASTFLGPILRTMIGPASSSIGDLVASDDAVERLIRRLERHELDGDPGA